MKIGILTLHRAENFGAVMQCWALQTFLHQSGHEVSIIDFRCRKIEMDYDVFNPSMIFSGPISFQKVKAYFGRLKTCRERLQKKFRYKYFRKQLLHLSSPVFRINAISEGFDVIIVGSDQVWNTCLTDSWDYFLPSITVARKIAYAVSSERYSFTDYESKAEQIRALLEDFSSISVREDFFKTELKKYTNKHIEVCCDPTFLISKQEYLRIASLPQENNYILVYHLIDSTEMSSMAKSIGQKEHKQVIEIHAGFRRDRLQFGSNHKYNLGPLELLGYIANASVVLTTSFHGTVFSILFEKQFWVVDNGSCNRQRGLLSTLGLQNRIVAGSSQTDFSMCVDYVRIAENRNLLVSSSINYLKSVLC